MATSDPSSWRRIPPRADQTHDRLIGADEQATMERRRLGDPIIGREEPILAYVARQAFGARAVEEQTGQPLTDTLAMYGEPATVESILLTVSRHLEHDVGAIARLSRAQQVTEEETRRVSKKSKSKSAVPSLPTAVRQQSPKARVATGGTLLGQLKRDGGGGVSAADDTTIGLEDFFQGDVFHDVQLAASSIHTDVRLVPAFRALVDKHNEQHQQASVRANLEHDVEKLPHPSLPTCTRQYRLTAMLPPRPNIDRQCRYATRCQCLVDPGRSGHGYIGREFYLPEEEPVKADAINPPPPRPCVLCLDADVRLRYLQYQRERCTPSAPLNTYVVTRDKKTGYPTNMLLIDEMEHRPTGIVGLYPEYSEARYEFRPIPAAVARRGGLTYPGAPTFFKMEVGLDFC